MRSLLHLSLLALSAYGFNDAPVAPQTERMDPRVGKPGTVIKITGRSLDRAHVDEVFLTDHRFDMKVKILEQSATQITVRVPPFVKPGRLQLLFLTAGSNPVYLEQPLYLMIEASDEDVTPAPPVEISQKTKPVVEVAASGTSIPVPMSGTPPSLATNRAVEKSVVPLKAEAVPVIVREKPIEVARTPPAPEPAPAPAPEATSLPAHPMPGSPAASMPVQVVPIERPPAQAQNMGNIPAQVVKRSRVTYPPGAAAQHVEGTVELIAVIRSDGRVKDVKVVKGSPFLVGAAMSSVREWVYEPAYVQGKPVESEVTVVLNFKKQ